MTPLRTSLVVLTTAALAGCLSHDPNMNENFGEAVRHNIAIQTINPDAGEEDASERQDGQKAASAVDAYREGAPRQEPATMQSLLLDVGSSN